MTLCIAAACVHEGDPRIVMCSDWQQQVEAIGGAENRNKQDWVKDGWPALVADVLCHAEELIGVYRSHLASVELTEDNLLGEMKIPAQQYKGILANDYIQQCLGIDYNYFLQFGKDRFPDEFFRDKVDEVDRIKLGASLIIAGFAECEKIGPYKKQLQPFIVVVDDTDEHRDVVRLEVDFACVGSGTYIAQAALFNREQHWERNLMYTIYSVYEAHAYASKVPGVGQYLTIDVVEPGGIRSLSDAGYDYCHKLYQRFGPRQILKLHKDQFDMKDEYLQAFDTEGGAQWE